MTIGLRKVLLLHLLVFIHLLAIGFSADTALGIEFDPKNCSDTNRIGIWEDSTDPLFAFKVLNFDPSAGVPSPEVELNAGYNSDERKYFQVVLEVNNSELKGDVRLKDGKTLLDYKEKEVTLKLRFKTDNRNFQCGVYFRQVNKFEPEFNNKSANRKFSIKENDLPVPNQSFAQFIVDDQDIIKSGLKVIGSWIENNSTDGIIHKFKVTQTQNPNGTYTVDLWLIQELDFEQQSDYNFDIVIQDESEKRTNPLPTPLKTARAAITVNVEDVHDQPPQIVQECGFKNVQEHVPEGFVITTVRAKDADIRMKNRIRYSIQNDPADPTGTAIALKYFTIGADDGILRIKESPDRESDDFKAEYATVAFNILAEELIEGTNDREPENGTAVSRCNIRIMDIDDQYPKFNADAYWATVNEHDLMATVTFFNQTEHYVEDLDLGENAEFRVSLGGLQEKTFEVMPPDKGLNKMTFNVRVAENVNLDYEGDSLGEDKGFDFKVLSNGILNQTKTCQATFRVQVLDINDQTPEFTDETEVIVKEHAAPGTYVTTLQAFDRDTDPLFGNESIRFQILSDALRTTFKVDAKTGVLSILDNSSLDREKTPRLYLSVEAADLEGKGNKRTAERVVILEDINDQRPIFSIKTHRVVLYENEDQFVDSVQVEATDADEVGNNNSVVNYKMKKDSFDEFFTVHLESGSVTLLGPLDFDSEDSRYPVVNNKSSVAKREFVAEVIAYDLGIPSLDSEINAKVIIDFMDVNDNTPVFVADTCSKIVTINETATSGTIIHQVAATDADISRAYNTVYYNLVESSSTGTSNSHFLVHRTAGSISIAQGARLEPELNNYPEKYTIHVQASDNENSQEDESQWCRLEIYVNDINNQLPKFETPDQAFADEVVEEKKEVVLIGQFKASDPDKGHRLVYSILWSESRAESPQYTTVDDTIYDYKTIFRLDPSTGKLTVKEVDRERLKKINLMVQVQDMEADPEYSPQISHSSVSVIVKDINDNDPIFLNGEKLDPGEVHSGTVYRNSINEHADKKQLFKVEAYDIDEANVITYSLKHSQMADNNSAQFASINSSTGWIDIIEGVDYDLGVAYHFLTFFVVATDNGEPRRSSEALVNITIIDINDNLPIFDPNANYIITINESVPVNTVITTLLATDLDSGEFGLVHYRMESAGPDINQFFSVNETSGELTVAKKLSYTLDDNPLNPQIKAFDNPFSPRGEADQKFTLQTVAVIVEDVNDNAPYFTNINETCFKIKEDHGIGTNVLRFTAHDKDKPNTDNTRFEFSLVSGNDEGYFALTDNDGSFPSSGQIILKKSVVHKVNKYNDSVIFELILRVEDFGEPRLNSTARYCIQVEDINNNNPIFIDPNTADGEKITKAIYKDVAVGTLIHTVVAEDLDVGKNGEVRYRLNNNLDKFAVSAETGSIKTIKSLEQEIISEFELEVEARDQAEPFHTSEENAIVRVLVKSHLDELPQFKASDQNSMFNFTEHSVPGIETNIIPEAEFNQEYFDELPNNTICYFITGTSLPADDTKKANDPDLNGIFKLDMKTRELVLLKEVDREIHALYSLEIKANSTNTTNCISDVNNDHPEPKDSDKDKKSSVLKIRIGITDINDHPPKFTQETFTAGTAANMHLADSTILTIQATDLDEGDHAIVVYSIKGDIERINAENLDTVPKNCFVVNGTTGDVNITFTPVKDMKGYFKFKVLATDQNKPEFTDTAEVRIYLMREDQQIVLTINKHPEYVSSDDKEDLKKVLEDLTNHRCNIDMVRAYVGGDCKNCSDILVHFVSAENTILEPDEAIRLVNQHYNAINAKLNGFRLSDVKKLAIGSDQSDLITEKQLKYMLIGLALFLLVSLGVAITLFQLKIQGLRRNLKAATATAFGSQSSGLNRVGITSAPNTNQHTIEGSNPMWNQQDEIKYQPEDLMDSDTASLNSFGDDNSLELGEVNSVGRKNPAFLDDSAHLGGEPLNDQEQFYNHRNSFMNQPQNEEDAENELEDDPDDEEEPGHPGTNNPNQKQHKFRGNPNNPIDTLRQFNSDWRRRATLGELEGADENNLPNSGGGTLGRNEHNNRQMLAIFDAPDKRRPSQFVPNNNNNME